jgi:hypothetical protein
MYVLKKKQKKNKNKQTKRKQTNKNKLKKIKKKIIRQFGSVFNKKMVKSVIVSFRTFDILCSMTSNICHVIFYVLRCLIKENPVQYFLINTISNAVNLISFIIITLIYYITKQRMRHLST